jgi:OmpA-OmpF porin, OOP family
MKCNPLRWLWGLLPVVLLGWAAVQFSHIDIETDLKKRVDAQLSGSGFKWSLTAFDGRDGQITGVATDEADPGRAYDIARSIWGVRVVDNRAKVIDKVEAYQWSVSRAGNTVRLAGHVPNEGVRAEIVKVAKAGFPGLDIIDEMKLARGVPSDAWINGVTFGIKQVAGLKAGEAKLDGLGLMVSGEAADLKGYRGVKSALATDLPKGVKLTDDRVVAPTVKPFVWSAKQGAGLLLLSGYVPSERARGEVLAAAKAALPKAQVTDRMEVAEGAANGHLAAAVAGLKELARLEEGSAEISDATMVVKGVAADPDVAASVRQGVGRAAPQGFRVSDAITARDSGPKAVSPYTTSATADAQSVVLSGFAPSEAAREQVAKVAGERFAGRRIDNRLVVAPGAPDGWQRCVEAGLGGAGRVGNGKMTLVDRRLDLAAATEDEELAAAVPGDVKAAAKTDCDANVRIDVQAEVVPELVWRAALSGNEVVLDGDVSSAAAKSNLAASAQRLFPGKSVVDRMRIVDSRSRKWPAAAEQGLIALAALKKGTATLVRQELTIAGEATEQAVVGKVRDQLSRDLAKGYVGRDQITVAAAAPAPQTPPTVPAPATPPVAAAPATTPADPVAKACQASLQQTAREGMIRFERASATLTRDSFPTLDRLAAAVKACPKIGIEIEGHTDAEGTPERNQRLSDRRAQSVVDYLTRGGVDASRLTAIGYGETRPLAPNDTAENRAKNRRIEFTVK